MLVEGEFRPVQVAVIGRTEGPSTIQATTAGQYPNVVFHVIGPARAIFIRFIRLWLGSFTTTIPTGATGLVDLGPTFPAIVKAAAVIATIAALLGLAKDLFTIFSGLESKYPLSTGGV